MKITEIESFVVRIPFDDDKPSWGAGFWADAPQAHPGLTTSHSGDITTEYPPLWRNRALYTRFNEAAIVKITTDNGLIGWGEIHTPVAGEVSVSVVNHLLAPLIYQRDPLDIQPLWETMYAAMRLRGHGSGYLLEAISGIDIALWDIAGKHAGVPVARLLGGQIRDRIPVYASSLPRVKPDAGGAGLQMLINTAHELVERGHRAFKIKLGINLEQDLAILAALREAVGPEIGIAVDVNGAYDFALARRAGKLMNEHNILWLEEPLMPENLRDYARLADYLDVAVAGGECLCNRWIFNDFLAAGGLNVIQPDVGRAGGISECKRISDLADVYGVPFAPHVSTGTAIYMAASLQWAGAGLNLMTCEWPLDQESAGNGILKTPFDFNDGFVTLPNRPGLGIEIDESALRSWET